ncbi:hypothetical protein [Roseivirga misakiensis]|uniref:Uncharacterized protein n=1 Tax=Roseivirga misakiensis TaxID=1563681 RepID=A0A1E5T0W4_9BACT|nr:hypothetical protein [Roseivirga misakiensis]OEK04947.1 hypothetical protein BFP71_16065 [Roseivirga misakiensis]
MMIELPFDYWNKLAAQLIITCAFLGGFSIAITANLIINKSNDKLHNRILKASTVSSGGFLITIFAFTKILLLTTEGYPFDVTENDINIPRIIGMITYLIGIISILTVIALSGWTKSRKTGIFTTIVGIITFILILLFF